MDNSITVDYNFKKVVNKSNIVLISKNQNKLAFVKYNDNIQIENK